MEQEFNEEAGHPSPADAEEGEGMTRPRTASTAFAVWQQIESLECEYEQAEGKANRRRRQQLRSQICELRERFSWDDITEIRDALQSVDLEERSAAQATEEAEIEAEVAAAEVTNLISTIQLLTVLDFQVAAAAEERAELVALVEAEQREATETEAGEQEVHPVSPSAQMAAERLKEMDVREEALRLRKELAEKRAATEKQRTQAAARLRATMEESLPEAEQEERAKARMVEEAARSERRMEALKKANAAAKARASVPTQAAPEWVATAAQRMAVRKAADALSAPLEGGKVHETSDLMVPTILKGKFSQGEVESLRSAFRLLDKDGNHSISKDELENVLESNDITRLSEEQAGEVSAVLAEADLDHDGEVSFGEFLNLVHKMRHGKTNLSGHVMEALIQSAKKAEGVPAATEVLSQQAAEGVLRSVSNFMSSDSLCAKYLPLSLPGNCDHQCPTLSLTYMIIRLNFTTLRWSFPLPSGDCSGPYVDRRTCCVRYWYAHATTVP